jgi:hypothetical protein
MTVDIQAVAGAVEAGFHARCHRTAARSWFQHARTQLYPVSKENPPVLDGLSGNQAKCVDEPVDGYRGVDRAEQTEPGAEGEHRGCGFAPGHLEVGVVRGFHTGAEHFEDVVEAGGKIGAEFLVATRVHGELDFQRCPSRIADDPIGPDAQGLDARRVSGRAMISRTSPSRSARISSSTAVQSSSLFRKFEYTAPLE